MENFWILAQADTTDAPGQDVVEGCDLGDQPEAIAQTKQADPNGGAVPTVPLKNPLMQMLPFILIFIVIWFVMMRGPRKKQQKQKQMVQSLAKNDKVQTIGGILGTVIDVSDDSVTLKIDEANNTKMKVSSAAISRVFDKD